MKSPDEILKERFADVGRVPHAFSSIKYLGTRTESPPTDFTELKQAVKECLANSSVRSSRSPAVIHKALMVIYFKFLLLLTCIKGPKCMHNVTTIYPLHAMQTYNQFQKGLRHSW